MYQSNTLRFWKIKPDGQNALLAYEHITGYSNGTLTQFQRIYDLWRISTSLGDDPNVFEEKLMNMRQVVRDIHFLLISLQIVWKSLQRLSDQELFPNFAPVLVPIVTKWRPFFEQYREPRNTFEHYDDQIFGPNSRGKSPGYGVKLQSNGSFALGSHSPALINEYSQLNFIKFMDEFENAISTIVGPAAKS